MKRANRLLLKSASWANLLILSTSLALETHPTISFADERSGLPGQHPGQGHGGGSGPAPHPTQTPAPTSTPTPTPTQTQGPDLTAARSAGRTDATSDGEREGRERGPADGQRAGDPEGFKSGFESCQRDARQHARDTGFQNGYNEGSALGMREGIASGDADGTRRGIHDGETDGTHRADVDSSTAATPRGQAQGVSEANSSDAFDRGNRDGAIRGDQDALAAAQASDYPRGRGDYRQSRYAEQTQSHDEIFQKNGPQARMASVSGILDSVASLAALASNDLIEAMATGSPASSGAGPDYRYLSFKKTYPTPQENQAYAEGARSGYADGFRGAYSSSYDPAYRESYSRGEHRGCEEARRKDYREDYERGRREGNDRGYHENYERAFREAANTAFRREYGPASARAYSGSYDTFYKQHFEEARSAAYSARVDAIYSAAFQSARDAKYRAMYPKYAQSEYQRGQADEAQDFAQRPIRITGIEATETIPNGVFEPGEAVRLHLQIRNFANGQVRAQDVGIQIKAQDTDRNVVTIGQEYLRQALQAKSLTEVREALEFQSLETAAERAQRFNVQVTYQGKVVDSTILEIIPRFMLHVDLAETPSIKEGIATPIRVKLTNIGNKAVSGVLLNLKTKAEQLEVAQPTASVEMIPPGQSQIVEFSAIGRDLQPSTTIALAVSAMESSSATGRRIGLMDLSRQFPIVNDYRIDLADDAVSALRAPGTKVISYVLKNEGHRLTYSSLQVKVRFLNSEDPANFVVIGPNPQFLMPMDQGESTRFVIPILVKAANQGAVIEVEVQEAGRTVVIHREDFSRAQQLN